MRFYSTAQVAARLGLAKSTVRGWCRRLRYNRMQGYMLSPEQVDEVRRWAHDKPGRPRLSKRKESKKRG